MTRTTLRRRCGRWRRVCDQRQHTYEQPPESLAAGGSPAGSLAASSICVDLGWALTIAAPQPFCMEYHVVSQSCYSCSFTALTVTSCPMRYSHPSEHPCMHSLPQWGTAATCSCVSL